MKAPKIGKVTYVGGTSTGGFLTNDNTLRLDGTGIAGAKITIFSNGVKIGQAKVDKTGNWAFDTKALPDGIHSFTAKAQLGKDVSPASKALAGEIDATAPPAPAKPDLATASDSGASGTDNITNDNTPTLTGTAEAGATVTIKDGATVLGTVVAHATTGAWTFTTGVLSNAAHSLTATATDKAGNIGAPSAALVVTVDKVAPPAPGKPDLAAASDTGSSNSDNLTNDNTPTLTGTAEAGATVTIKDAGTVLGTAVANGAGQWSFTTGALSDGAHSLTATATDKAGNIGPASAALAVTVETVLPAATIVVADTALKAGETSLVTITFSEAVTGLQANDLAVANGAVTGLSSSNGGITWTGTLTPTASLTDTSNVITLTNGGVEDLAGNAGTGATTSNNYAIDTARPTATIVVADTALKAGETSLVTITFSEAVTGLEASDLTVANGAVSGLSTSNGGITWTGTLTPTASITDTTNVITVANGGVTDGAGNAGTGTTTSNNYAIDTAPPDAPTDLDLAPADDSGTNDDDLTNVTTDLTITGGGENGATVTLFDDTNNDGDKDSGESILGTALVSGAAFSIDVALAEGVHHVRGFQTDAAGNVGAVSTALDVSVDTTAPAAAAMTFDNVDGRISDSENDAAAFTVTGVEAGSTATVTFTSTGGGTPVVVSGLGNGASTADLSGLADGIVAATIDVTDGAGNTTTTNGGTAILDAAIDISVASANFVSLGQGFRIFGADISDEAGFSVSSAGDINGDGFDDMIVGARFGDGLAGTLSNAGEAIVVFGKAGGFANIDVSTMAVANGFRIFGANADDQSGWSVSSAGDINGDGFDDIIFGARYGDGPADTRSNAGEAIVIFGKAGGFANIDVSTMTGTDGFRIFGADVDDKAGISVSSAGDVNGDGIDDLIVGAYQADGSANLGNNPGEAIVVFGKATGLANIDVSSPTFTTSGQGFRIFGADNFDNAGWSVSSAGDVNGDGFDDLILGAPGGRGPANDETSAGEAIVIFGKATGFSDINVSAITSADGFRIFGDDELDNAGRSVSSAGDINGDGFDDLIVGAHRGQGATDAASYVGEAIVVFGKASGFADIDVSSGGFSPAQGFRIFGQFVNDRTGDSVSSAGDINGDGYDDLLVGASSNAAGASKAIVVFGKASGFADIDLFNTNLASTSQGFRILAADSGDFAGCSVSSAGDIDGDGFDDLIVGARGGDGPGPSARPNAGEAIVIFGADFLGGVVRFGTSGVDTLTGTSAAETFVSGQGADTLIGNGGADSFRGGEGNDTITVSDLLFRKVDGGSGTDTLVFSGTDRTIDFTTFANNKVTGIEAMDVSGSGNDIIVVGALDALHFSDTPHAGFTAAESHKRLVVNGGGAPGDTDTLDLRDYSPASGGDYTWVLAHSDKALGGGAGGFDFYNLMRNAKVLASIAVDADMSIL